MTADPGHRFRVRLSMFYRVPLSELLARWTEPDIRAAQAWEESYGLPDAYFATGQICQSIELGTAGTSRGPAAHVPYFEAQAEAAGHPGGQDPEETRDRIRAIKRAREARHAGDD